MTKILNESVLEAVTSSGLGDYDQRSALGMARSWLDNGELAVWHPEKSIKLIQYPLRDQLAADLVAILQGEDKDASQAALAHAREAVNAPFVDTSMVGWRANRLKAGLVGSEKKNLGKTPARGGVAG